SSNRICGGRTRAGVMMSRVWRVRVAGEHSTSAGASLCSAAQAASACAARRPRCSSGRSRSVPSPWGAALAWRSRWSSLTGLPRCLLPAAMTLPSTRYKLGIYSRERESLVAQALRAEASPIDIRSPARFINRELSWLAFNERVLAEAGSTRHPLLERLRFLSISASNLDEFYMVRVAGLKGQVLAGIATPSQDGLTPAQQLQAIARRSGTLMRDQQVVLRELRELLGEAGLAVVGPRDLSPEDKAFVTERFWAEVFPILTPLAVDPAHPFPFIANWGLGFALQLSRGSDGNRMEALLLVPQTISRFIRLPGKILRFISLEDVIGEFLDHLFPGFSVIGKGMFRILRDSEVEVEEEAEDLVRLYESALKRRRRGHVILLCVEAGMPDDLRLFLGEKLDVSESDVIALDGLLGLADLRRLIVDERPDLLYTPYNPRFPERIRDYGGDCFAAIGAKDIIVHHP